MAVERFIVPWSHGLPAAAMAYRASGLAPRGDGSPPWAMAVSLPVVSHVVALVPDLMDRSKVAAAARGVGATLSLVSASSELTGAADGADLVIVDLARPGVLDALAHLTQVTTLGFASHVDRDLLASARRAGCHEVLARSAFFRRLPNLLATWDGTAEGPAGPRGRDSVGGDTGGRDSQGVDAAGEDLGAGR